MNCVKLHIDDCHELHMCKQSSFLAPHGIIVFENYDVVNLVASKEHAEGFQMISIGTPMLRPTNQRVSQSTFTEECGVTLTYPDRRRSPLDTPSTHPRHTL